MLKGAIIMKAAIGCIYEPFEFITVELIKKIDETRKEYKVVGVGIPTDAYFYMRYSRKPIKPYSDRSQLAKALKGVDFVFPVDSETDLTSEIVFDGTEMTTVEIPKPYKVAYAPGTYDLLHEGHLAHLTEVKSLCDILIVGVNSDKLVYENKRKKTKMSQEDRLNIVKNLEFVDYVFMVETNLKSRANKWSLENVGLPIDVIFLGSDLRGQNLYNDTKIPILFTERDPVLMRRRSSSFYRQVLEGLKNKEQQ